jgi:trigger factor
VGAFDSLKDLQAKIRTDLEEQESRRVQISAVNGAIEQLLAKTSFDAPATLVAQAQMQSLARDSEYLKSMGMTFKDLGQEQQDYWESSRRSAEQRVRADLILHAIGEQAKIEVTDADVEAEIERMAEQAGRKALAIRAQLEAQKRLDALREQIAQDKIREHLAGAVKLTKAKAKPAKAAAEPKRKPAKKKKSD